MSKKMNKYAEMVFVVPNIVLCYTFVDKYFMQRGRDLSSQSGKPKRGDTIIMVGFTVFFQMLALLLMIGIGALAQKKGLLDEHTNKQISGMVVNIFNPLLIFSSAADTVGNISLKTFGLVSLIALGMFLFYIVTAALTAPLFDRDPYQRKLYQLMFVFSNLGFIGIPVVKSVLGAEYVVYVTEFLLMYTVIFYTYGIILVDGRFTRDTFRSMLNPGNVFWLASILIIEFQIQLPGFVKTTVSYMGNATTPIALMSVGYMLATLDLKQVFGDVRLYIYTAGKMLLLPLVMVWLLHFLPVDAKLLPLCLIMFGMPNGNMPLMVGTQKGIDCTVCTSSIIVTTVLSVVTIPVLLTLCGSMLK